MEFFFEKNFGEVLDLYQLPIRRNLNILKKTAFSNFSKAFISRFSELLGHLSFKQESLCLQVRILSGSFNLFHFISILFFNAIFWHGPILFRKILQRWDQCSIKEGILRFLLVYSLITACYGFYLKFHIEIGGFSMETML